MDERLDTKTSASLLAKLLRSDEATQWNQAWVNFYNRYAPMIMTWCRKWGLQEADAEDVSGCVLAILARRMKSFDHDPSARFRSWLKTVVENEIRAALSRKNRRRADYGVGTVDDSQVLQPQWDDPSLAAAELTEELDRHRTELHRAMEAVRAKVHESTWAAFQGTAIEDRPAADVAAELKMSVVAVYKARSRVQEQLREIADSFRLARDE